MYLLSVILLIIGAANSANVTYNFCGTNEASNSFCNALKEKSDQFDCLPVNDSATCAIRLAEGKADLAIFDAEEMLLAYQFYPYRFKVISELRDKNRSTEEYEFQSVAVINSSFDDNKRLAGLEGFELCHPGFSDNPIWNDRILKYFEKKVYGSKCSDWNKPAIENEIFNLKAYFGKGCIPGAWVSDKKADEKLKSKYHELCELCDDRTTKCTYLNKTHDGHFGALECLNSSSKRVAYVRYEYLHQYFHLGTNSSGSPPADRTKGLSFLCEDGTTRPLTKEPCEWINQPWRAIVARTETATEVLEALKIELSNNTMDTLSWTLTFKATTSWSDGKWENENFTNPDTLKGYLTKSREVNLPENNPCGKKIRWCTANKDEMKKCNWVAKEAIIGLDIQPNIECRMADSTFQCLENIANQKADIAVIDPNYGYVARTKFKLRAALYAINNPNQNNRVIAIVRENATEKVTSLSNLKNRKACFPKYNGIAWLSFLNVMRTAKIISDSCDYSRIVSEFLSGACTPGIRDADHSLEVPSHEVTDILCSLCPAQSGSDAKCSANHENHYYGDEGAFECLRTGSADVAFVETKNLLDYIDEKSSDPKAKILLEDYRVLCKNGSLANGPGFKVDDACALSVIVDSEIISRNIQNNEILKDYRYWVKRQRNKDYWRYRTIIDKNLAAAKKQILAEDVTWTFLKLGSGSHISSPIGVYNHFNRSSTAKLYSSDSSIEFLKGYEELFNSVEPCSKVENTGVNSIIILVFVLILFALIIYGIKKSYCH